MEGKHYVACTLPSASSDRFHLCSAMATACTHSSVVSILTQLSTLHLRVRIRHSEDTRVRIKEWQGTILERVGISGLRLETRRVSA